MSQKKSLRKSIREMIKAELNEESLIGKWFRKLAKTVEDREYDRLMSQKPEFKKGLEKINKDVEKEYLSKLDKYIKKHKLKV